MNGPQPLRIFDASVLQDKYPPRRITADSPQPVTANPTAENRPKHHGSEKRQTVGMGARVFPHIKVAYKKIAKQRGEPWTESSVAATALEEWLEFDLGEKFGVRLSKIVSAAINSNFQSYDKHIAFLSIQGYLKAATTLNLLLDFLRLYVVRDPQKLHNMLEDAENNAKKSLGHWGQEQK
jgi:hypothetical protein